MTDSDKVKIAVLQTQMKTIDTKVDDLKRDQKEGFEQVLSQIAQMKKSQDEFHQHVEDRFATKEENSEVKKIATNKNIITNILTVISTAIITSLVIFFFTNVK